MDYSGPLFGKHGQHYVPLRMSAADVDEMLDALEAIHALALDQTIALDLDHDLKTCIDTIIDEARAAIAKAKGETK